MNIYRALHSTVILSLLLTACAVIAPPNTPTPIATLVPPTPIPPTLTFSPEQQQKIIIENKIKRHLIALGITTCENCTIKNLSDNSTEALVQKVVNKDGKEQEIILSAIGVDGKETPYKVWKMQSQRIIGTIVDGAKVVDRSGTVTHSWNVGKQEWVAQRNIIWKKDRFVSKEELSDALQNFLKRRRDIGIDPETLEISGTDPRKGFLWQVRSFPEKYAVNVGLVVLSKIAVEKKSDGSLITHILYMSIGTKVNAHPFTFRVTVPLDVVVVSQSPSLQKPFIVNSLGSFPEDTKISALQTSQMQNNSNADNPWILFRSPKTLTSEALKQINTGTSIATATDGYVDFVKKLISKGTWKPFIDETQFTREVEKVWLAMIDEYVLENGDTDPIKLILEVEDDWVSSNKIPQLKPADGIYMEPFFSN